MTSDSTLTAESLVHEARQRLSRLAAELRAQDQEEPVRRYVEAIESATAMTEGLLDLLRSTATNPP